MAVSGSTNRVSFSGNGSTTAFSFPHYVQDIAGSDADLKVVLKVNSTGVETVKTITTHYTVAGTAVNGVYPAGVTVTMLVAPATGETLIIYRDPALTQGVDLAENDSLPAETIEQALDKLTLISQRLDERIDRSITLPEGFTATFDLKLPHDLDDAGGKVLTLNEDGDGFADVDDWPTIEDIADAEANATAAAASAAAALVSEGAADTSADLAADWASKINGQVIATEFSAKAWAIGGTNVTDTASRGAAKEWAIETASTVDGTDYSAKEWAKGTQVRGIASGGSAKDWATYTGGTVDNSEYSAKYHATAAAASAAASGFTTGDVKLTFKTTADTGFVMMNDGSIGSASSGATARANADTATLYALLWTNVADSWAAVAGGRGANAAADFAANKAMTLTKALGHALGIAGAGSGLTSRALGSYVGAETVTLDVTMIPSHTHTQDAHTHTQNSHNHTQDAHTHTQNSHTHAPATGNSFTISNDGTTTDGVSGSGSTYRDQAVNTLTGGTVATNQNTTATNQATTATNQNATATNQNTGGGLAHANMQPTMFMNVMIKL